MVGVAADDGVAVFLSGEFTGAAADFVGAADEDFALAFGQAGDVVGAVEFLQAEVDAVGEPGEDGVVFNEVVEDVAVDDEDVAGAGGEGEFFDDGDAEEVGDDFGGAVVVADDPDDVDFVGEVTDLGEDFPVGFLEAAEVDGVEDVAVDDEAAGADVVVEDLLEEGGDGFGLAVFGTEVEVGNDDGVEEVGGGVGIAGDGRRGEEFWGEMGGQERGGFDVLGRDHSTLRASCPRTASYGNHRMCGLGRGLFRVKNS